MLAETSQKRKGEGAPFLDRICLYRPPRGFFPANGPSPFVQVHGSLRVTPAMEADITDHIWTMEEICKC